MISSSSSIHLSQYEVSKQMKFNNYLYKCYYDLESQKLGPQNFGTVKDCLPSKEEIWLSEFPVRSMWRKKFEPLKLLFLVRLSIEVVSDLK